jgi:hypothetical protein
MRFAQAGTPAARVRLDARLNKTMLIMIRLCRKRGRFGKPVFGAANFHGR